MGLTFKWLAEFEADTKPCDDANGAKDKTKHKSSLARLSLANLAGAFAVLAVGILISAIVFVVEMLQKSCRLNV
jgi:ionotropic glutamate receptor